MSYASLHCSLHKAMPVDNRTPNLNLPLPDSANKMASEDLPRLQELINALDGLLDDRPTASAVGTLISDAINTAVSSLVSSSLQINTEDGIEGGGALGDGLILRLSAAVLASLQKADTAAQGSVPAFAGAGIVGGGLTGEPRTFALSPTSLTSLEKAESAVQLAGGKIPSEYIPSVAITDFLGETANQSAMLDLSGEPGDWTIRTDLRVVFVLVTTGGSNLSHWRQIEYPAAPVTSVNGQAGAVSLNAAAVGADPAGTAAGLTAGLASQSWVNGQISDLASEGWVNDQLEGLATSGSGGNGRYVRLPGGVLLMWNRLTSHGSNAQTWNYPVDSDTDPRVMITPEATSPRSVVVNTPGKTSANFRVYDQNNNQIAEQVQIMAIGTWV